MNVERVNDQILSGPAGVAGFHDVGCVVLQVEPRFSEGRAVRPDLANPTIRDIDSRQYRGGTWTREYANVHSVSSYRTGFSERTGNASDAGRESRLERWLIRPT